MMRPDLVFEIKEMLEQEQFENKDGHKDPGEKAYIDWATTQAARFRKAYETHESQIEAACREHCPDGCKGPDECPMDISYIHQLLED